MITVGTKMTHDGAVALFDGNSLIFSVELEKLGRPRYAAMEDLADVEFICQRQGFHLRDVDRFCVDGWKGGRIKQFNLDCAPYHQTETGEMLGPLDCVALDNSRSYQHLSGHVLSTYMMSPFEVAYCLVWDGMTEPRLFHVTPKSVKFICAINCIYGSIYGVMGYYFGPYKVLDILPIRSQNFYGGFDKPGKLMSYIALGLPRQDVVDFIKGFDRQATDLKLRYGAIYEHELMRCICRRGFPYCDADILASIHKSLQEMLVEDVKAVTSKGSNLLFTGGCALNIKWNSALRADGHFKSVWVPPVPNDAGSAIGAACCDLFTRGFSKIDWQVYCGPDFVIDPVPGWTSRTCSAFEAGQGMDGKALLFLTGRAEIGPRALGHRSILMTAKNLDNQQYLNRIKHRESFRPVAPIVIEDAAKRFFEIQGSDPYMLFDHKCRDHAKISAPAIVHLDNTARVQTIREEQCPEVFNVISGNGERLLCNTSANENGYGFFPSLSTAMQWAESVAIREIYSEGLLWTM